MKYLLVLVFIWSSAARIIHRHGVYLEEWKAFKLEHNKNYSNEETEHIAMKNYARNKYIVAMHNKLYERGKVSFRLDINKFADKSLKQFSRLNGYRRINSYDKVNLTEATYIKLANVEPPKSIDWRKHGAVTQVKDQKECGAGWAFGVTGALEGQLFRNDGRLVALSEQNLIDCSWKGKFQNKGCDNGHPENAFAYVKFVGGIDTESSYPYEAVRDECRYEPDDSEQGDVGISYIPVGNEEDLMMAVATVGPIVISIDANHDSFKLYTSGVYYEKECSSENLSHSMLLVGYGRDEDDGDYWLVKNSYGPDWGEHGYIRLARFRGNHCGVATEALYPLI